MRLWRGSRNDERDLVDDVERLRVASPEPRVSRTVSHNSTWLSNIDATTVMADHLYCTATRKQWARLESRQECVVLRDTRTGTATVRPFDAKQAHAALWARKLRCEAMLIMRNDLVKQILSRIAPMNNFLRIDDTQTIRVVDDVDGIDEERGSVQDGFLLCRQLQAAIIWTTDTQLLTERCRLCEQTLASVLWPLNALGARSFCLGEIKIEKDVTVQVTELTSIELERDIEGNRGQKRSTAIIWPIVVAMSTVLVGLVCGKLLYGVITAIMQDDNYAQAAFILYIPIAAFLSAFFLSIIVVGCFQMVGPISQLNVNSLYYSGKRPNTSLSASQLPHITVQCPVYKEDLWEVIDPTIQTVTQAISIYEAQGGTASIIVNDDGLQLLDEEAQLARRQYYELKNIGWTARPRHGDNGFVRAGAFKKASNLNYGLRVSLAIETMFESLVETGSTDDWPTYEEATERVLEVTPGLWCEGDVSLGDFILLIDADTRVPQDCFLDAANEFFETPELAILQHASDVLLVSNNNFWENAMAHFTRSNYFGTRYIVASGDATPFFGHNAFLRWSAMDSIATMKGTDRQWWSEAHVSEDFELSLKLQTAGYITRLAGYSVDGFKEGVSLTVYDEISRWEKYAFGVCELIFNPFQSWFRKGPFTPLFRQYVMAPIDLSAKCSALVYMGTYFGIGLAWLLALLNYFLMGWFIFMVRDYYTDSLQILTAVCVIFGLKDAIVGPFVRYRVKEVSLFRGLIESLKYFAITTLFLQGISMHVSRCLLLHLFGRKMSWGSTSKSLEERSVQSDLSMIWRRFKFMYILLMVMLCMVVALGIAVPTAYRITSFSAIFPLAWMICWHALVPLIMHNRSILNEIYGRV